jgi:hypothetical protein
MPEKSVSPELAKKPIKTVIMQEQVKYADACKTYLYLERTFITTGYYS